MRLSNYKMCLNTHPDTGQGVLYQLTALSWVARLRTDARYSLTHNGTPRAFSLNVKRISPTHKLHVPEKLSTRLGDYTLQIASP